MTELTARNTYLLLKKTCLDKEQMHEYSNKRYSFCRIYAKHYLIHDSKTGVIFLSVGDNPAEALYYAVGWNEAEWEYNERKSKSHVEPIYTCSFCGADAWGDRERTPYCYGCGAKMANTWEEEG